MFWKKRLIDSISLTYETTCKRAAFRYYPPLDTPIILIIDDQMVDVVNISASGVGFKNDGFKEGYRRSALLAIPGQNTQIRCTLSIRYIDDQNICHCEFIDMTDTDADSIHQFVFECQMRELRTRSG